MMQQCRLKRNRWYRQGQTLPAWCNTKNMTPLVWHNISHISSKYGSLQPISSLVAIIRVVLCKVPFWRATESPLEGWLEKGFSLSRRLDIYVKKVMHNAWRAKNGKREGRWRCISISLETMFQQSRYQCLLRPIRVCDVQNEYNSLHIRSLNG